jgi:hypothetical protein
VENRSSIRSVQESLTSARRCASGSSRPVQGRHPWAVLATEEVLEGPAGACERGVTVQILDDRRRDLEPRTLLAVSARVASVLDVAQTGTVTARDRPQGGPLAVTICASGRGQAAVTRR